MSAAIVGQLGSDGHVVLKQVEMFAIIQVCSSIIQTTRILGVQFVTTSWFHGKETAEPIVCTAVESGKLGFALDQVAFVAA
jgi:hypothetical protein